MAKSQEADIIPGEYITEGVWENLLIKKTNGSLFFEILTVGANAHICTLEGNIDNNRSTLEGPEDNKPCIVSFKATDNGIEITDNDSVCSYYCGMGAGFTDLYIKPEPECTSAAIQKSRNTFKQLYDKKNFVQARQVLEPMLLKCAKLIHWPVLGWVRNDLAITLYKLGEKAQCRKILEPLEEDTQLHNGELVEYYAPADAETMMPIAKATQTNIKLCSP